MYGGSFKDARGGRVDEMSMLRPLFARYCHMQAFGGGYCSDDRNGCFTLWKCT